MPTQMVNGRILHGYTRNYVLLFKFFYLKYVDLPSGVLGELEVSSDPRLRESVLLKQGNSELRAATPTATPPSHLT